MIDTLRSILFHAWEIILKYFQDTLDIQMKWDNSPVTKADIEASEYLIEQFNSMFTDDEVLSEEKMDAVDRSKRVWVIDPLDGTAMFINGVTTFSVMIACIEKWRPIFSAVYYPISWILYRAEQEKGSWREKNWAQEVLKLWTKQSNIYAQHLVYKPNVQKNPDALAYLEQHKAYCRTEMRPSGYIATEFLERKYDELILGTGNIYEIAATDLLIQEAGGEFWYLNGWEIIYDNKTIKISRAMMWAKQNFWPSQNMSD